MAAAALPPPHSSLSLPLRITCKVCGLLLKFKINNKSLEEGWQDEGGGEKAGPARSLARSAGHSLGRSLGRSVSRFPPPNTHTHIHTRSSSSAGSLYHCRPMLAARLFCPPPPPPPPPLHRRHHHHHSPSLSLSIPLAARPLSRFCFFAGSERGSHEQYSLRSASILTSRTARQRVAF